LFIKHHVKKKIPINSFIRKKNANQLVLM